MNMNACSLIPFLHSTSGINPTAHILQNALAKSAKPEILRGTCKILRCTRVFHPGVHHCGIIKTIACAATLPLPRLSQVGRVPYNFHALTSLQSVRPVPIVRKSSLQPPAEQPPRVSPPPV